MFHAPVGEFAGLTIPPLAAGAGTLLISSYDSQLANAAQNAANILNGSSLAGHFWTPTGGGHTATLPGAVAAPKLGPDLKKNLAAQKAAAQAVLNTPSLDPDFPYGAAGFDLSLITP